MCMYRDVFLFESFGSDLGLPPGPTAPRALDQGAGAPKPQPVTAPFLEFAFTWVAVKELLLSYHNMDIPKSMVSE